MGWCCNLMLKRATFGRCDVAFNDCDVGVCRDCKDFVPSIKLSYQMFVVFKNVQFWCEFGEIPLLWFWWDY